MTAKFLKSPSFRVLLQFTPVALFVLTLSYLVYRNEVQSIYADMESHREELVEMRAELGKAVDLIARDLLYLSNKNSFRAFISQPQGHSSSHNIESDWRVFISHKKIFDQLRWIDETGRERIRINFNDGYPDIVTNSALQDKSGRYYFRDSNTLPQGSVYLSAFDLNMEHGAIDVPIKPVLRLATPVFDYQGNRRGVVVLNYLGKHLLQQLHRVHGSQLWLLNSSGYWMVGPSADMEWGFMIGQSEHSMTHHYPVAWERISAEASGVFEDASGYWVYETIAPANSLGQDIMAVVNENIRWPLVYHQPRERYMPSIDGLYKQLIGATIFVLLVIFFMLVNLVRARQAEDMARGLTRAAEAETIAFLQQSPDPLFSIDSEGDIVKANQAAVEFFGYPESVLLSMRVEDLMPVRFRADHVKQRAEFSRRSDKRRMSTALKQTALLANGEERDVSVNLNHFLSVEGETLFTATVRDVTEDQRMRKLLEASEEQMRFLMQNSPTAACILTLDHLRLVYSNPAYRRLACHDPRNLNEIELAAQHVDVRAFAQVVKRVDAGETVHVGLTELDIPERGRFWVMASYMPMHYYGQGCMLAWFANITEMKQYQDQLEYQAQYDILTGLPNRALLQDRLSHALQQTLRRGGHMAVVFIDLDGFKQVNDRFGHEAGDYLLITLAQRMQKSLRESDTIGRLGGDEFVAILGDLTQPDDCLPLIERILAVTSEVVVYQGDGLKVSSSLGITLYPQQQDVACNELLVQADEAMYLAKRAGKNRYRFFVGQQQDPGAPDDSDQPGQRQALS